MKNLLFLHLESVSWQRFSAFRSAFPHTRALFAKALVFENYFSSATSTLMVVSYLAHGNDFEFDAEPRFEAMRAAGNLPHLFSVLQDRGYQVGALCLNAFEGERPFELSSWPEALPPVRGTHDVPTLYAEFEKLTDARPFALNVWNLITHVEHSMALAAFSEGYTDQIGRACALADEVIGHMLAVLERKGLLANTTIVLYGDHGDDFWTHGFKSGLLHGVEPYTSVTWSPLAILDPSLPPGVYAGLASTIDLRPTCLSLLGIDDRRAFEPAGIDLLGGTNEVVFAQNFTASQPDNPRLGIARAFAATDDAYSLLATARGLELYAYRFDPGNHCNLLHFFAPREDGLALIDGTEGAAHFRRAFADNPRSLAHIGRRFVRLREALANRLAAKREFVVRRGGATDATQDASCFARFNREGRDAFLGGVNANPGASLFDFSFTLR